MLRRKFVLDIANGDVQEVRDGSNFTWNKSPGEVLEVDLVSDSE